MMEEQAPLQGGEERAPAEPAMDHSGPHLRIPEKDLLQLTADLENLRKTIVSERDEAQRAGVEAMVRAIAPALDALRYAIAELRQHAAKGIVAGLEKIDDQFVQAFASFGIVPIATAGSYDPKFHEAVERVPGVGKYLIAAEVSRGWMWRADERVILPAKVKVGSGEERADTH